MIFQSPTFGYFLVVCGEIRFVYSAPAGNGVCSSSAVSDILSHLPTPPLPSSASAALTFFCFAACLLVHGVLAMLRILNLDILTPDLIALALLPLAMCLGSAFFVGLWRSLGDLNLLIRICRPGRPF